MKHIMITFLYYLGYLLMITLPLLVGFVLHRRRGARWRFFFIGALTFVFSQILHIPFNWLVLQQWQLIPTDTAVLSNLIILSIFLGLSAGVFEEGARYLTYRFWATDARSWGSGLMLGTGHGGIEAILVALIGAINIGALVLIRLGFLPDLVPPDQMHLLDAQMTAVFDAPWYTALLPLLERALVLPLHMALSLMVMQVFTRGFSLWLLAAILWHGLVDAVAVFSAITWGIPVSEALLAVSALVSVGVIFWLKAPEPEEPEREPLPAPENPTPTSDKITSDMLDRSRYS